MKPLTPTERDALTTIASDGLCEADATITADELGPDLDSSVIDSLEQRGAIDRFACPGCSLAEGHGVDHSNITHLGHLALRLANATLSDLVTT